MRTTFASRQKQPLLSILSQLLVILMPLTLHMLAQSTAPVPHLVKYSGLIKESAGKAQTLGITFALYKDEQGGSPLWLETQNVQLDAQGHYSVYLGSTKSEGLPQEVFVSGEARWMGVQVQGQAEQAAETQFKLSVTKTDLGSPSPTHSKA